MGGQENCENSKWLNFELRTYNSDLGRFNNPDPYSQFASAYVGMGNNPINGVDPSGGMYNNWGKQQIFFQELNAAAQWRSQYLLGYIDQGSILEDILFAKMSYWEEIGVMGALGGGGGGTGGGFGTPLVRIPVGEYRAGEMPAGVGNVFTFYDAVDNGERVGRYRTREAAQARLQEISISRALKQAAELLAKMGSSNNDLTASLSGGGLSPGQGSGGEFAPNSAFTMRGDDVDYKTLFNEFKTGTGPEYSGFGQDHPMTMDMQNSLIVTMAMIKFLADGGKPLINYDVPFGLASIPLASQSMTEQFIGGARVSIIPTSVGTAFIVNNSTGLYSASFHTSNDINRVPGQITPYGTIYQRFMWIQK